MVSVLGLTIEKESLDRKAARQLREAILSGALPPGKRITEQMIASELALSRGTIRTALHHLSAEGLIVQNIYSSWEVMGLTAEDAGELYTLRSSLEGLAGRLAAQKITPDGKKALKDAFEHLINTANSGTARELANADLGVHIAIVELSENKRLIDHYRQVALQLKLYVRSINEVMPSAESVAAVHEPIVEAVLRGDPAEAEALLVDHSTVYGEKLVALFSHRELQE